MSNQDWSTVEQVLQTAIDTIDKLADEVLPASAITSLRAETGQILKNAKRIAEEHTSATVDLPELQDGWLLVAACESGATHGVVLKTSSLDDERDALCALDDMRHMLWELRHSDQLLALASARKQVVDDAKADQ